ncbi:MAG: endonuclease/exonuclease/phosphatase family protein [Luteolibacter sp.]
MQKPVRLALLAIAALFLTPLLHAAGPLKFVSWNLEWFPGHRPTASAAEADAHMKAAQEALKKINPDIFVGVEIHDWAAFDELVSAVPGLNCHVVSSFCDPVTGELRPQQIGIASKLKCHAAQWENWAANVPEMSRGFSFAALEVPDSGLLMVYGNHLKSNRGSDDEAGAKNVADMRNDQAKQLLAHREKIKKAFAKETIFGWIASGDFNTNHDGQFPLCQAVKIITDGGYFNTWANTPKEKRLTWHPDAKSKFQPTTFDYIFTDGLKQTDAVMLKVPDGVSDHSPVSITVEKP